MNTTKANTRWLLLALLAGAATTAIWGASKSLPLLEPVAEAASTPERVTMPQRDLPPPKPRDIYANLPKPQQAPPDVDIEDRCREAREHIAKNSDYATAARIFQEILLENQNWRDVGHITFLLEDSLAPLGDYTGIIWVYYYMLDHAPAGSAEARYAHTRLTQYGYDPEARF